MGFCINCIAKCLDDDEPNTYNYTTPLVQEEHFDVYNNTYVFKGGAK